MRILYFFPEKQTIMNKWQRVHFIDELCRNNCLIEVFNPLFYNNIEEANEKLIERARLGNVDLFMTNLCNEKWIFINTLEEIKKLGIPTLSYRGDNLVMPFNDKVLGRYFDLVWLTAKETEYLYKKWDINTVFAPYAANPYTYKYYRDSNIIRKCCFIGTPYGSRSIMINSLTESGLNVDLYYGGTALNNKSEKINDSFSKLYKEDKSIMFNMFRYKEGRRVLKGSILNRFIGKRKINESDNIEKYPSVMPEETAQLYSQYCLAMASTSTNSTDALHKPLKIINLRNFEIPMSGGIEICKYNPELAEYFEDGKEIILYQDNEDLIDKVRYFTQKASETEIRRIKEAARKRAESDHTWMNRFRVSFDKLGLKYNI